MRIFSRRSKAPTAPEWQPMHSDYEVLIGEAAIMEDRRQASAVAYRTDHRLPANPGAQIEICTYIGYAADDSFGDEGYQARVRYRYTIEGYPSWSRAGFMEDPWDSGAWVTYEPADAEARELASFLAEPCGDIVFPTVFCWNGEPW